MKKKSCKGSATLGYLERLIDEIDVHPDNSRSSRFNRAIVKAQDCDPADWQRMARELKKFRSSVPADISAPTAMQITVEEQLEGAIEEVERNIKSALDLEMLQTRYLFEILNYNYWIELKKDALLVGQTSRSDEVVLSDLSAPDMIARLAALLILNRKEDEKVIEEIKKILIEWKG